MKYFLKQQGEIVPGGSLTVEEINVRIQDGVLSSDALATADFGEPASQIEKSPERDWIYLCEIPGVTGVEKPVVARSAQSPPNWTSALIFIVAIAVVLFLIYVALLNFLFRGFGT